MGAVLVLDRDEQTRKQQGSNQVGPGQHQLSIQQWAAVWQATNMSNREKQVVQLLFDGLTRQKVSEQMGVSTRTVRHHMERIHLKLGVSNRVGVVLKIIQLRDQLNPAPLISSQVVPSAVKETLSSADYAKESEV